MSHSPNTTSPTRRRTRAAVRALMTAALLLGTLALPAAGADAPWSPPVRRWSQLVNDTNPPFGPHIYGGGAAYDEARGNVVVFGRAGLTSTWDGTKWTHHNSNPHPAGGLESTGATAYDPLRGQVVYFDSRAATTWVWNGTRWAQKFTDNSPSPRNGTAMAFDGNKIVLFGGGAGGGDSTLGDTWSWNGLNWKLEQASAMEPIDGVRNPTSPPSPRSRRWHDMVYDAARNEVVLFGGESVNGAYYFGPGATYVNTIEDKGDTWVWNGIDNTWSQRSPATSPSPRSSHVLSYDSGTQRVLMHGGSASGYKTWYNAWLCEGSGAFLLAAPYQLPLPLPVHAPIPRQVQVGSSEPVACPFPETDHSPNPDLWAWDGQNWTELHPLADPSDRGFFRTVYDQAHGYHLRVGGMGVTLQGQFEASDIWAYRDTAAPPAAPAGDFDGDASSDIAVFRPSDGTWYNRDASPVGHGAVGDVAVAGDYDGDSKVDPAVFRPSSGTWLTKASTAGDSTTAHGSQGDIAVPADYDGDAKTDIAVFRPSNATWYIKASTAGDSATAYGAPGDIPVPADYDGDEKADIAIFRPSTGTWYVAGRPDGVAHGAPGDIPLPANYDGDAQADMAVFRPSTGTWYLRQSSLGTAAFAWGTEGDIPVPAAYGGGLRADVAVFRPSTGTWYLRRASEAVAFGTGGDIPATLPPAIAQSFFAS